MCTTTATNNSDMPFHGTMVTQLLYTGKYIETEFVFTLFLSFTGYEPPPPRLTVDPSSPLRRCVLPRSRPYRNQVRTFTFLVNGHNVFWGSVQTVLVMRQVPDFIALMS